MRRRRSRLAASYFISWEVFGTVGLLLNIGCMVLMLLPWRGAYQRAVRAAIARRRCR